MTYFILLQKIYHFLFFSLGDKDKMFLFQSYIVSTSPNNLFRYLRGFFDLSRALCFKCCQFSRQIVSFFIKS